MKKIKFERNKIILAIIDILIIALACIFSKFLLSNTFYFKVEEWKQIGITIALSIVIYQIFLEYLIYTEALQDTKMEEII